MNNEIPSEKYDGHDLLEVGDLADLLKVSPRTIWRLLSGKSIPEPVRVGERNTRWRRTEIYQWIDAGCPSQEQEI